MTEAKKYKTDIEIVCANPECMKKGYITLGYFNSVIKKGYDRFSCSMKCLAACKRQSKLLEKRCNGCKKIKDISFFNKRKTTYGDRVARHLCRECEKGYNDIHHDPLKKTEYQNKIRTTTNWRKDYDKKYREKNADTIRESGKKWAKKNISEATDYYIRRLLSNNVGNTEIYPPELIKLKRIQLICKRTLKIKENEPRRATQQSI